MMISKKLMAVASILFMTLFLVVSVAELAEARSRGGGRSFSQPRQPASQPRQPATQQQRQQAAQPTQQPGATGGLGRGLAGGLAGGLLGGMLGGMLFGSLAHGMGGGGLGGSGLGLIEILLIAGVGYFIYRRFFRRPATNAGPATNEPIPVFGRSTDAPVVSGGRPAEMLDAPPEDSLVAGVKQIWEVDNNFDPDGFKDIAQDLFFTIQAAWTQRNPEALAPYVGDQLLAEYAEHFEELRQKGHVNRLENIAVRKVELLAAGVEGDEIFVAVRFTANLLDYTLNEHTGEVVEGDSQNPVKFQETWSFARPVNIDHWKLEGIEA